MLSYLSSRNEDDDDEAYKTFSLKPTRNSIDTIEFIDTYSSRNMFISYCDKPRDKRERIIFTDIYENIMKAINENKQTHIVSGTRKTFVCMPYDVACGKDIAKFESMRKYGPQFAYESIEETCVELTDLGIKMFNTFYVHRPVTERVDGNKYYFRCSHHQIFNYFARFGKEAYILYPEEARSNMHRFFAMSEKNYRKRINEENSAKE